MSLDCPGMHSRRVPLRTGPTLRVSERAGSGGTLLLLHGYSDSGRSFEPVVPWLPADWRVLAPDQRGHGDSDRPEGGYAVADLAADAAALLDEAGVASATVWRDSDTVVATTAYTGDGTMLVTEPGVLDLVAEDVTIRATAPGEQQVTLAIGREVDVTGWVGEDAHGAPWRRPARPKLAAILAESPGPHNPRAPSRA